MASQARTSAPIIIGCAAALALTVALVAPSHATQTWAVGSQTAVQSSTSAQVPMSSTSSIIIPQNAAQVNEVSLTSGAPQFAQKQATAVGSALVFFGMAAGLLFSAYKLLASLRCCSCGGFGHHAAQCQRVEALALLSTTGEKTCCNCGAMGHTAFQCQTAAMFSSTGEKVDESKEKMRRMVESLDMADMRLLTRGGSMAEVARSKGIDEVAVAVKAELASRKDLTPKDVILEMQRGNGRFWMGLSEREDMSAMQRRALIMAQAPKICILSCSDSRVPVEIIFDQGLGEIFVVRMAGNILDTNAHGSIEYAVKYLGVKVLLVIGHEGCGAVKGAITMSADDIAKEPEELQVVLKSIKTNLNVKELNMISDMRSREREAIVLNTSNQVKQLQENKLIAEQVKEGKLMVAGAFYEISSGIVDFFSLDRNGFVVDM